MPSDILEVPFKAENGKPPAHVLHRLLDAVSKAGDTRLMLTLKEVKRKRSLNQNALYWGYIVPPIADMFRKMGTYVDHDDVHDFLKLRVGKMAQVFVTPDGEVHKGLGSTTRLTKQEFSCYIEAVLAWAAEYGVEITLPTGKL